MYYSVFWVTLNLYYKLYFLIFVKFRRLENILSKIISRNSKKHLTLLHEYNTRKIYSCKYKFLTNHIIN